jgi:hypothetical protein
LFRSRERKIKALLEFYTLEDFASVQRPGMGAFRAAGYPERNKVFINPEGFDMELRAQRYVPVIYAELRGTGVRSFRTIPYKNGPSKEDGPFGR